MRAGAYGSSKLDSVSRKSSSRSSVVVLKRKTPKIDPWGQPPVTGLEVDQVDPTRTAIVRSDKKVAINLITGEEAPFLAKAWRQCWKDNRLKALA